MRTKSKPHAPIAVRDAGAVETTGVVIGDSRAFSVTSEAFSANPSVLELLSVFEGAPEALEDLEDNEDDAAS